MIIAVSASQIPVNVSVTGSNQSLVTVSGQSISPVTLVVSTSAAPVNVTVPEYTSFANTAGTSSYSHTASYALTSAGTITNAISSSYTFTASFAETSSYAPSTFPYTGDAVVTGTLTTTDKVTSNQLALNSYNGTFVFTASVNTGIFGVTETIYPVIDTGSFSGAIIEYIAQRTTGIRIGVVMGIWDTNGSYTFTDVSSMDVGDTADLVTGFLPVNNNILFQVHSAGSGSGVWTVQSLFKLFPKLA